MEASKEKIKKIFKENFLRELSEEEVYEIYEKLLLYTKLELSKAGLTEKQIEEYFKKSFEMVFSPGAIHAEVFRIANEIGIEALENSKKYKRLSEMMDASCLAIALKKLRGEEWMIKSQDQPDTLLVKRSEKPSNEKPFNAFYLEVMQIPENIKESFKADVETEMAKFIKDKKFYKRYGRISCLLVHLNFNYTAFKIKKLSEELCILPGNPFHQIYTRTNTDPNFGMMDIAMIYPKYSSITIDFKKERDLFY